MSDPKITKENVLALIDKHYTVEEMAKELGVDYEDLFNFYVECSFQNRSEFPIGFLLTKSWLEKRLKTTPVASISIETKISPSVIRRLAKKYGIETKPLLKDVLTPEVLHALFIDQFMSDSEIATKYSCSIETIKKLRRKYNITSEARIDKKSEISIEFFHKLYVTYGFTVQQLSTLLGITPFNVLCLKDKFAEENHPLSVEIKNRKRCYTYHSLIDRILKKLDPALVLELLKTQSLAEIAEGYGLIPPPEPGIETFSKEWLEAVLKKMDMLSIAKEYYIGQGYINSLMSKHNLKPVAVSDRLDAELVRHLFVDCCWTDDQIAFALKTSEYAIKTLRKKQGIKPSQRPLLSERLPLSTFIRLYVEENLTIAQISDLFGVSEKPIVALKSNYSKNEPCIKTHVSTGATEEKIMMLKKQLRFKGLQ